MSERVSSSASPDTPRASQRAATRSRRMILWLVVMPTTVLLLTLAGANWKRFHLAYCRQLIASDDPKKQYRGVKMVLETHLRVDMPLEEIRAILVPARVTETGFWLRFESAPLHCLRVSVRDISSGFAPELRFDEDDRLHSIVIREQEAVLDIPLPGK